MFQCLDEKAVIQLLVLHGYVQVQVLVKSLIKIAKSGACNGATKDFTIKKNDTYVHNITIASNSSTASSSTHCNAVVTIKSWNFETDPPYWGSMIASVSGAKCTTGSFNAGWES